MLAVFGLATVTVTATVSATVAVTATDSVTAAVTVADSISAFPAAWAREATLRGATSRGRLSAL